jgi:translation initiation factor 4G
MSVCKERPATLPPLDAIGLEPVDHTHAMSRGGSGHHRPSSAVPPSRQASISLGFTPALAKFGANNLFSMGNFARLQNRVRSKRGEDQNNDDRVPGGSGGPGHGSAFNNMNQMPNIDPVVPLQATENRWDRKAIQVD